MFGVWGSRHKSATTHVLKGRTSYASWVVGEEARPTFHEFRASPRRGFFSHRLLFLPKCCPDGRRLSRRMCGIRSPDALWEVVLYAEGRALQGLPSDLFFDPDIVWHGQHFGLEGHVAYASLARRGRTLYALNYVSDVVQRISRRKDVRSRVENRFSGWADLLVNAVLRFALASGCRWLKSPVGDFTRSFSDPERNVQTELFERVYDRTLRSTLNAKMKGNWWVADVRGLAEMILPAKVSRSTSEATRRICLIHDTERGSGHRGVDPDFARRADQLAPEMLRRMLYEERRHDIRATYNVVGNLLAEVRSEIAADGHCIAFHSFDHSGRKRQLPRCREVDYRLRGYRPPQSRWTRELRDSSLSWNNFDWLAMAERALGMRAPYLQNGIVKIPILTDDYALYRDHTPFDEWAERTLSQIREREFAAIGLHDCYGEWWTPNYEQFLSELSSLGQFMTMDEVADEVFRSAAV